MEQLLQSLIDEDDADQSSKSFLSEACDVTDKRAGIRGDQQQTEEGRPQANAGPQGEVREAIVPERTHTDTTPLFKQKAFTSTLKHSKQQRRPTCRT